MVEKSRYWPSRPPTTPSQPLHFMAARNTIRIYEGPVFLSSTGAVWSSNVGKTMSEQEKIQKAMCEMALRSGNVNFEWDEAKNQRNQRKHEGISFELAALVGCATQEWQSDEFSFFVALF